MIYVWGIIIYVLEISLKLESHSYSNSLNLKYCSPLNAIALDLFFSFFPPCSHPLSEGNRFHQFLIQPSCISSAKRSRLPLLSYMKRRVLYSFVLCYSQVTVQPRDYPLSVETTLVLFSQLHNTPLCGHLPQFIQIIPHGWGLRSWAFQNLQLQMMQ